MLEIRRFKASDLKEIVEIEKTSFPQPWPEAYFKKAYKEHPNDFLVAKLSGRVTGYILGYAKSNKSGLIKTLAVNKRYRRQGIGRKLVNFTIQRLKQKGLKKIVLHIRKENQAANSFYKKVGFRTVKIIKKYYPNGQDAYLMEKDL